MARSRPFGVAGMAVVAVVAGVWIDYGHDGVPKYLAVVVVVVVVVVQ